MKLAKVILCAITMGASCTPAFADTVIPYVGAVVGYDHVKATYDPIGTGSKDGVVYGGIAGVDYMFMQTNLVGVEAEASGASTKESVTVGADSASVKAGRDFYVGVRTGFVIAPHVLAYVKGGYTNARFSTRATLSGTNYAAAENLDGWRLGGGAEAAMKHFRVRVEYRYSDYGQLNYQGIQTGVKVRRHQVVLGALVDL